MNERNEISTIKFLILTPIQKYVYVQCGIEFYFPIPVENQITNEGINLIQFQFEWNV